MAAEQCLAKRVAFITGSNRKGIGRAIARRLAAHGASVVLHGSRETAELEEARDVITAAGGTAACIAADLSDETARASLIARAAGFFGPIDILVNNAALTGDCFILPSLIDLKLRRRAFEVNFEAPVDLIQQALPAMRAQRWGRIINISSRAGEPPQFPPTMSPKFVNALTIYGASKAALDRYTTGLAMELHGTGVTVNATMPYAISWTADVDKLVRKVIGARPETVEPLEMLAEATFLLVTRDTTGLVLISRDILRMHQAPLHALDGVKVIGDAATLVSAP